MLSARVTFMSVYSYCPCLQIRELAFQRLIARARDTANTEEKHQEMLHPYGGVTNHHSDYLNQVRLTPTLVGHTASRKHGLV